MKNMNCVENVKRQGNTARAIWTVRTKRFHRKKRQKQEEQEEEYHSEMKNALYLTKLIYEKKNRKRISKLRKCISCKRKIQLNPFADRYETFCTKFIPLLIKQKIYFLNTGANYLYSRFKGKDEIRKWVFSLTSFLRGYVWIERVIRMDIELESLWTYREAI